MSTKDQNMSKGLENTTNNIILVKDEGAKGKPNMTMTTKQHEIK
jgi:hypothetical protein